MRTTGRHVGAIGAVLTAVVLAAGAVAWACTTAISMKVSPGAAPAGAPVTVTANQSADGPVSIRWQSVTGQELGTAPSGGSFSVRVRIPADAQPGVATILAVQEGSESGRASLEVTPGAYTGDDATTDPTLASSSQTGSTNGSASAGTRSGSETGAASDDTIDEEAVTSAGQSDSTPAPNASPSPSPAPAPVASAGPSTASSATGARSAPGAGAAAAAPATANGPAGAAGAPGGDEAPQPVSAASSANDLWSGFSSGEFRGAPLDDHAPSSTPTSPLTVSALALAAGLAAMMAGFGVAEARRRRAVSPA